MSPLRYTLRHNATTFDWELADAGTVDRSSRHATHISAFAWLASDPRVTMRGATVQIFGADGGFVQERAYPTAVAGKAPGITLASSIAA